ncbi:sulfatase [Haloferax volcanii]|uniref:Sulfatase n=1 Tax=Haloferax volcanii TaxID=2246 RepID=A0A558GAJ0_HALVO|nr:sulfatase [Haloferax volcanii]TVT94771.1 sulfatase [Haloferax volcanii]
MSENTILITTDALRKDHLSQYGYHRDTFPEIDTLLDSGRGQQFDHAYANGSYTKVSVPSFLTSRLNGVAHVESGPTIASVFSDAGFDTLGVHSNTWLSNDFDGFHGFDTFIEFTEDDEAWSGENSDSKASQLVQWLEAQFGEFVSRSEIATKFVKRYIPSGLRHSATPYVDAEKTTNTVINWLNSHSNRPFFIWVHYMDPHRPFGISSNHYLNQKVSSDEVHSLMSKAGASPDKLTEEEEEIIIDLYDSDIRFMSSHIQRLFEYLKANNLYKNTNIALTSDHGEELGEHGMYFHRNKPYGELINVPLFIKSSTKIDAEISQLIDIGPTLADLQGINIPSTFEGSSLLENSSDVAVSSGYIGERDYISVTDSDHKLIQRVNDPSENELYELSASGYELNEIHDTQIRDSLRKYISNKDDLEFSGPSLSDDDNSVEERLEDLGYL